MRPSAVFTTALVLSAEALGALLIHKQLQIYVVVPIVIISVAVVIWVLEPGLEACISRWDWAARRFGMRLNSGASAHGYWFTTILGEEPDGTVTVLGAS